MLIFTWILQIAIGAAFLAAGYFKATQPYMTLANNPNMVWVENFSPTAVRTIGILEFLAGVGIIFPHLFDMFTWLTPLAALGLMMTMIGAMAVHIRRGEFQPLLINVGFFVGALIIFFSRLFLYA